jgi:hypothetical protein
MNREHVYAQSPIAQRYAMGDRSFTPDEITKMVCSYLDINNLTLPFTQTRTPTIVQARQLIISFMHLKTQLTNAEIGKLFGKYHSIVLQSEQALLKEAAVNYSLFNTIRHINTLLNGTPLELKIKRQIGHKILKKTIIEHVPFANLRSIQGIKQAQFLVKKQKMTIRIDTKI